MKKAKIELFQPEPLFRIKQKLNLNGSSFEHRFSASGLHLRHSAVF